MRTLVYIYLRVLAFIGAAFVSLFVRYSIQIDSVALATFMLLYALVVFAEE